MSKIGRNDPCHCGSGKKYKKCCHEKDLANVKLATPDDLVRFFKADESCVVCGEPVALFGGLGSRH